MNARHRVDPKVNAAGDDWLTVKDVAEMLKVCTATVYKVLDRGELQHARVLNSIRVKREDLASYCLRVPAHKGGG